MYALSNMGSFELLTIVTPSLVITTFLGTNTVEAIWINPLPMFIVTDLDAELSVPDTSVIVMA